MNSSNTGNFAPPSQGRYFEIEELQWGGNKKTVVKSESWETIIDDLPGYNIPVHGVLSIKLLISVNTLI